MPKRRLGKKYTLNKKRKRGTPFAHFTCSHEPENCSISDGRCFLHMTPNGLFRRQIKDKWKEFIARRHGLRVVRFDQESIWADSYDWRAQMRRIIKC